MIRLSRSAMVLTLGVAGVGAPAIARPFNFDIPHVADQLIVKFKPLVTASVADATLTRLGGKVAHRFQSNGAVLVTFNPSSSSFAERVQALEARSDVEYVEPNTLLQIDKIPDDAEFGQLYGMNNTGEEGGTVDADIDAPEAWDVSTGSRDVLVGIIDTGVDYTHPDIAENYWHNPGETGLDANGADKSTNGIDDDGNGFIDDFRGWDFANNDNDPIDDHAHGTHCAGTIGGRGNNGVGVAGVNWEVSIVGIKFLTGAGSGNLADAVKAIEYGTLIGVNMMSNSWGGGDFSETMDAAIRAAGAKDILFIAAAGNDASNNDISPHYPSSYTADNVISVAATDRKDGMAIFSSYGATTVDVGAPGVDILSSVLGGLYTKFSGTSMATPHVTGVAALIKSVYPNATAAEVKARILNTSDPVVALQGKTLSGGRVNAYNALEDDTVAPNAPEDLTVIDAGISSIDLSWKASGDDADVGSARRYDVRYATSVIRNERDWDAAIRVATVAGAATRRMTATITNLPFNTQGFVAMKAIDNVGNIGPMSDSTAFQVRVVAKVLENNADTLDGVTADVPWALETIGGVTTFSDSPAAPYGDNVNASLTLDDIAATDPHMTLVVTSAYDFESGYDFGYVEVSTDAGVTWTQVDKVTGTASSTTKAYDLTTIATGATSIRIRFRVTSDYSISKDGWHIDTITVFAPLN